MFYEYILYVLVCVRLQAPQTLVVRVQRGEGQFHQVSPLFAPATLDLRNCIDGSTLLLLLAHSHAPTRFLCT